MARSADDWAARIAGVVAGQVRRYRHLRGLSTEQLALECRLLGFPLKRSVLANFESGRRQTVTVAEVMVLARALKVPPIMLIFPLGRAETSEVSPDDNAPTWRATKWFMGELGEGDGPDRAGLPGTDDGEFVDEAFPLVLHCEHDSYLSEWRWARKKIRDSIVRDSRLRGRVRAEEEREREAAEQLARLRHMMRASDIIPPPLPRELVHLDKEPPPGDIAQLRDDFLAEAEGEVDGR